MAHAYAEIEQWTMQSFILFQTLIVFLHRAETEKRWFVLHATTYDGIVRLDYYEQEDHKSTELASTGRGAFRCGVT